MKQPELGLKLSELRKQKNLTQEELVEACNVSVRTIQRIESGEVSPRISTVKILLSALEADFETFKSEVKPSTSRKELRSIDAWLQAAWIAGIIYFVLGFVDAGFEYSRFESGGYNTPKMVYVIFKILYFTTYTIFIIGLAKLSDFFKNYLLKIAGYLMIAFFTMITGFDIFSLFMDISDENLIFIGVGESMSVGVVGILLGIGLIRLQDSMGILAKAAGIIEIVAGFFFLLVIFFWAGYIMLIPSTILEIILLFKASEFIREELQK
ncbi:MAG: helix-turn-helix transcriptional regulator [Cyclobacteriaceae bacterium]